MMINLYFKLTFCLPGNVVLNKWYLESKKRGNNIRKCVSFSCSFNIMLLRLFFPPLHIKLSPFCKSNQISIRKYSLSNKSFSFIFIVYLNFATHFAITIKVVFIYVFLINFYIQIILKFAFWNFWGLYSK